MDPPEKVMDIGDPGIVMHLICNGCGVHYQNPGDFLDCVEKHQREAKPWRQ